jgi:hypothetical protein
MKNSKEYSAKLRKLYLSLRRRYPKPRKVAYTEPVDALVYAIVSENITETAAQAAMKKFADYFVDLNDLRVSRIEEIVEMLALDDVAVAKEIAFKLAAVLKSVFNKFNMVCLESLKKMSKKPARQFLEKFIGENHVFVVDYCMLTALHGHAVPLTKKMIEYLRTNHLVHPGADLQEIAGFLERQISADNAYEFYSLLRRCSETDQAGPAAKVRSRKKS